MDLPSIDGYESVTVIGRGRIGMVYRAERAGSGEIVAVKMLGPHVDLDDIPRLAQAARATSKLHHAGIATVHEVCETSPQPYLIMEYVEGQSLAQLARSAPLSARQIAEFIRLVAIAVHYAHCRDVCHLDLKPDNVLIASSGEVKVVNFGQGLRIQPSIKPTPETTFAEGKLIRGTPGYMAPERAQGQQKTADVRADVYSLGAMLYELLTGRPPFHGESDEETLNQAAGSSPLSPRAIQPSVSPALATICMKCLDRKQAKRYETAQAVADDVGRFLGHVPIKARPPRLGQRLVGLIGRHRLVTSCCAVLFLAAVAGGWLLWLQFADMRDRLERHEQINMARTEELHRSRENVELLDQTISQFLVDMNRGWLSESISLKPLRKSILQRAIAARRELKQQYEREPNALLETRRCFVRIGAAYQGMADNATALEFFEKARTVVIPIASPASDYYLAEANARAGDVLRKMRQDDKAVQRFREALQYLDKHRDELGEYQQQTRSQAHFRYAQLLWDRRDVDGAWLHIDAAIRSSGIVVLGGKTEDWAFYQAATFHRLGATVAQNLGQTDGALKLVEVAGELTARLCTRNPQQAEFQALRADILHQLGTHHGRLGNNKPAEATLRQSVVIQGKIVREHGYSKRFQLRLAEFQLDLADQLTTGDSLSEAAEVRASALQRLADCMTQHGPSADGVRLLARARLDSAVQRGRQENSSARKEALSEAAKLLERRMSDPHAGIADRRLMARLLHQQGVVQRRSDRSMLADATWQKEIAVRRELARQFPQDTFLQAELGRAENNLGTFRAGVGKTQSAIEPLSAAARTFLVALKRNHDKAWQRELQVNMQTLIDCKLALRDHKGAAAAVDFGTTYLNAQPAMFYGGGVAMAKCASVALKDPSIEASDKNSLVATYQGRAVKLLARSLQLAPTQQHDLTTNSALDGLRKRDDFVKLVGSLKLNIDSAARPKGDPNPPDHPEGPPKARKSERSTRE